MDTIAWHNPQRSCRPSSCATYQLPLWLECLPSSSLVTAVDQNIPMAWHRHKVLHKGFSSQHILSNIMETEKSCRCSTTTGVARAKFRALELAAVHWCAPTWLRSHGCDHIAESVIITDIAHLRMHFVKDSFGINDNGS